MKKCFLLLRVSNKKMYLNAKMISEWRVQRNLEISLVLVGSTTRSFHGGSYLYFSLLAGSPNIVGLKVKLYLSAT